MFEDIIQFIRTTFRQPDGVIHLHEPQFSEKEKHYVIDAIESTFVSSVGKYVTRFEELMKEITGTKYAIATVNGTTALHLALILAGVRPGDEVITQPLTFIATSNAITHAGGVPVYVDVDKETLGMSPKALRALLEEIAERKGNELYNKVTGRRIVACLPMHTFGFPLKIDEVKEVCDQYGIVLVEDAAESLGSYYKGKHTGTFGSIGTFSFNGNKTVTCGGGGAIITNDEKLGTLGKHLSTTAKVSHSWEFVHDAIAYNYRMPNLNAALACAQLERLNNFLENKRALAELYRDFFQNKEGVHFVKEPQSSKANYWLNTIVFDEVELKEKFLSYSNNNGVKTRPIWKLMTRLPMYQNCYKGDIDNAEWLEQHVVNLPSSFRNF